MANVEICITSKQQSTFYFSLIELFIDLNELKRYFPNARGLSYKIGGESFSIDVCNGAIKLCPNISEYAVIEKDNVRSTDQKLPLIEIIKKYFFSRLTYKEICHIIKKKHSIQVSVRTIQRIVRKYQLKRKNIIESPIENIVSAILSEVNDSGLNLGYRALWQRLRDRYRLNVKHKTVLKILNIIDPEGIENRSRYRLKRRKYSVPGPNYLWHIDGFDKLKKFGFTVHGCVDGFSRKVIWLHVSTSNNNPQIIAYYYLKAIKELKFIPSIIRLDRRTENTIIDLLQMGLRHEHTDGNARENSFIKGKSTANERIEKYWRQLKNHTLQFYISLFKTMMNKNILDIGNILHIECLRFCFSRLIQYDLEISKKEWNEHRLRKQKKVINLPCGIPNIIYHWPERYGQDCQHEINEQAVSRLMNLYGNKPILFSSYIEELVNILLPNEEIPRTCEDAYNLFLKLTELIDLVLKK